MSDERDDGIPLVMAVPLDVHRSLRAEHDRYRNLLERAVKYATEDRAVTPGTTRLARLLDEARAALHTVEPHPEGCSSRNGGLCTCVAELARAPAQPEAPKVDPWVLAPIMAICDHGRPRQSCSFCLGAKGSS